MAEGQPAYSIRRGLGEKSLEEGPPSIVGPDDQGWLFPKKGAVFVNGHLSMVPEAPTEVPIFVQFADKKGEIVKAYWQDGAAFKSEDIGEVGI